MTRTLASLLLAFGLAIASGEAAWASFANELPRAPVVVSFHPRSDEPFTIDQLRAALRAGAHGVELDLRWRATDAAVVCAHEARDVEGRPTLAEALDAILAFQGTSPSVQKDGLQFYITLDLKESGAPYHHSILDALRKRKAHWSASARPGDAARGITVVVSGMAEPLAKSDFGRLFESLYLVEGRDADRRVLDLSDRDGPLAWVALQHPVTRERIRALHEGSDAHYLGRYNVRVYGAGRRYADAIAVGADAVNADLDEIARARERISSRPKAKAGAEAAGAFWLIQDCHVEVTARAKFVSDWRGRAASRRERSKGWRGQFLFRSEGNGAAYRVVERWKDRESWQRSLAGASGGVRGSGRAVLGARAVPCSTSEFAEVEDRLGSPSPGDHVRFYRIRPRLGMSRAFHRAWRRANDAIRAAHPAALGSALLRDPGGADALVEIVRWKSEAAWRRFVDAAPPDREADAVIRAAIRDFVAEPFEAIEIAR